MKKEIGPKDLVGKVKQKKGIARATLGSVGCTPVWSRLQQVGSLLILHRGLRNIKDDNAIMGSFTGNVEIFIRQGGITEDCSKEGKRLNRHVSKVFREDVFPSIKNFAHDCTDIFNLILHYNDNFLMKAELHYIK